MRVIANPPQQNKTSSRRRSVKERLQDIGTAATLVLATTAGGGAVSKLSVNPLFSDGMVLNANRARMYGQAPAGEPVAVSLPALGVSRSTVTEPSGRWLVDLGNLTQTGPLDVHVQGSHNVTLSDVHVGQVFVFTGASNVRHPLHEIAYDRRWGDYETHWRLKAQDEILRGTNPLVRVFDADKEPHRELRAEHTNVRPWQVAAPESYHVGALPYLFARRLQPRLGVAVGIVQVAAGASISEHWLSEQAPSHLRHHRDASIYYNTLLAPLNDYDYTALVIYQGESETSQTANMSQYEDRLVHWIARSRADAGRADLPVIVVGTSGMRPKQDTPTEVPEGLHCYDVFATREAQIRAVMRTPNSAYVVTSDIGDTRFVHAPNKWDIAERIIKAERKLVHHVGYPTLSPIMSSWHVQGREIIIHFNELTEPVAPGHQVGCAGPIRPLPFSHVAGLAIADASYRWTWANASFSDAALHVFSDAVSAPVAVRYAWARNPIGNLYSFPHGQPLAPFRTDTLPMLIPANNSDHACSKGDERAKKPFNPTAGDVCPA